MLHIKCPHCGMRSQNEFSYGGDASVKRPELNKEISDEEWNNFVYNRKSLRGKHWEHLCLDQARVRTPIGSYQPVDAKARVVDDLAKISTIRPSCMAFIRRNSLCEALVNPIPYEASLAERQALKEVPPLVEIARRVAHSMCVCACARAHVIV